MASFADVHNCILADISGGSKKVQNCAEVIYGWTLGKKLKTCLKSSKNANKSNKSNLATSKTSSYGELAALNE